MTNLQPIGAAEACVAVQNTYRAIADQEMASQPPNDHALILAGIIRQVDGARKLSADALASAVLAHPGSRWRAAEPPAAPRPKLPKDPPVSGDWGDWWRWGYEKGWDAARAELQRQQEQSAVIPAAPTFPHISDDLMRSLVCDILYMLTKATDEALGGGYFSPIPEIRARLMEVLQLAAQDAP